ncbi:MULTISPECIES: NACHT domain-containing NTPase [unclassified Microcoleus]|uniref:NACHT domain-containing protein n=1 Tax=unclassified Microcoleus TaxID=2642155 RepID=UPI0025D944D6|nr:MULTISPECIES: NACHT domain-containing protein [unclassified Microcoleus]
MLEWLLTLGAAELGKAIFEQVLKLGQSAAEDYVKDFFKGCLQEGIAAAKPEVTKKSVAEALKAFLLLITDELEDRELSKAEIRDRYDPALVQFIKDDAVKPILGKAFEKDCRSIDATALSTIWHQSTLKGRPFPTIPEEFDWQRVGREYLKKVRRIIRETPELRSLLETELLEDIARNTTPLSPGFDVAKYRESLQCSYGHLKLYAIDSTDRVDAIKLWNMFIEQTVREALPPMRYELPLDLKRQLQEQGQLAPDLSPEALEHYRQEYFQQPSRKVLEAVADSQRAVILGDPGAGKSTLLQYLALDWVEGKTELLPLLIELREYAIAQTHNFLEFLHCGRGVNWQFDRQQLHQHLQEHPTLVMFDGLDEVFDRATQSTVIDDIIRFAQQYPKAQVLITSRIVGYNPDRLQHAKFRHFTIQPLDTDEMHEFIDRWYELSMGSEPDKERLKQRLKDAIANSKAIQNLADNPLLLTMMAILNRRQELPRDRADLYDQASRVLLYHWDVDHKRLQLPMDAIGRREKQEMLRAIAYEMQAGDEGLKGNLISADRLTLIVTNYLREQGFSEPREKANRLTQQLRERNFILCYRGADTYGFVHRTFLEYFCAIEIVNRFEKQRILTFEQLRDEIFGQHWQDETWHEVLQLICGMIDASFVGEIINFLMRQDVDKKNFFDTEKDMTYGDTRLKKEAIHNLLLAAQCLMIVPNRIALENTERQLLYLLKQEIEVEHPDLFSNSAVKEILRILAATWQGNTEVLAWLKSHLINLKQQDSYFFIFIPIALLQGWKDDPDTLLWIKKQIQQAEYNFMRQTAMWALAEGWKDELDTLSIVKNCILHDEDNHVKSGAIRALVKIWRDDPKTLIWIKTSAQENPNCVIRYLALRELANHWKEDPEITELFFERALKDPFKRKDNIQPNPRLKALQVICQYYPNHLKTLPVLRDRATNDRDEQLREWAQEQLKMQNEWK